MPKVDNFKTIQSMVTPDVLLELISAYVCEY